MKSVDTDILGVSDESCAGSSPALPTSRKIKRLYGASARITGPYIRKKDGRRVIELIVEGRAKTMQLARLILEIRLGRVLGFNETADHEDGDCTNDSDGNIRLLSRVANASIAARRRGTAQLQSSTASGTFYRSARVSGSNNGMSRFSEDEVVSIRSREPYHGLVKDLMQEYGVSRRTIQNLLKGCSY